MICRVWYLNATLHVQRFYSVYAVCVASTCRFSCRYQWRACGASLQTAGRVCENCDGWLVARGLCERMLIHSSTVWLLPFTFLLLLCRLQAGSCVHNTKERKTKTIIRRIGTRQTSTTAPRCGHCAVQVLETDSGSYIQVLHH